MTRHGDNNGMVIMEELTAEDLRALQSAWGVIARSEARQGSLELYDLFGFCEQTAPLRTLACGHLATLHAPDAGFIRAETPLDGKDPAWKTLVHLLQPGDRLELHWIAAHHNRVMMAHGIALDALQVRVHRPGGAARDPLTFAIRCQGFAIDSDPSQRMILTGHAPEPGSRKVA